MNIPLQNIQLLDAVLKSTYLVAFVGEELVFHLKSILFLDSSRPEKIAIVGSFKGFHISTEREYLHLRTFI